MRIYAKLAITALVSAAALAAFVSSASAGHIRVSNPNFRVTWSSLEFNGGGANVRCRVTLEGTFHETTIQKVEKTLIGYVTRAILRRPCTNGEAWIYNGSEVLSGTTLANSLPWHVTWGNFRGALPNITEISILLERARFLVEVFGLRCNYTAGSTNGAPRGTMRRNTATGEVDTLRASSGLIRSENPFPCPEGTFESRAEDGRVVVLGTTTRITVTLI